MSYTTLQSDWRYGRVCKHRRAGDDVSIYISKKQKSTEDEETRKGKNRRMKDDGEETRR
jgi:hypothetical protein